MSNSPNAATILPPAPAATPAPQGDLQAAVAAMQASMAAGETARAAESTPAAATPPPASTPPPPSPSPAPSAPQADPNRPPPPTEAADDRYTRLYASFTETERQLQELRRVNAELRGQVVDPAALESLPVSDRLKRVGLTPEQVFDAWTESLSAAAPSVAQPQAQDPQAAALLQKLEAMAAELKEIKESGTRAAEQQRRSELEATATSVIVGEAQKAEAAYPLFLRLHQAGYRDEHGRTPAQLAIAVGDHMMQLAGGIRPQFEAVLGAVEEHYRQRAQIWAPPGQGTTTPGQPATPPQQTQAQPPAAPPASPGGDTPEPRDFTPDEAKREAVRILRQRLEDRERGAGQ